MNNPLAYRRERALARFRAARGARLMDLLRGEDPDGAPAGRPASGRPASGRPASVRLASLRAAFRHGGVSMAEACYARSEAALGLPEGLVRLADRLALFLPAGEDRAASRRFLEAAPEGGDARSAGLRWTLWLLSAPDSPLTGKRNQGLLDPAARLLARKLSGEADPPARWEDARQALRAAMAGEGAAARAHAAHAAHAALGHQEGKEAGRAPSNACGWAILSVQELAPDPMDAGALVEEAARRMSGALAACLREACLPEAGLPEAGLPEAGAADPSPSLSLAP